MSSSGSSKKSSKSNESTIIAAREAIKSDYYQRFRSIYRERIAFTEIYQFSFSVKPFEPISLEEVKFINDMVIYRPGKADEALEAGKIYKVTATVNIAHIRQIIRSIKKEDRDLVILLTNGPDPALLNEIQLYEVTNVKSIIWYNASSRGHNFFEAERLIEVPRLKKQNSEAKKKINEITMELKKKKKSF